MPDIANTTAVVMLKGMTCLTENCGVTDLSWVVENGILSLSYKFTLKFDFSSPPNPMKAHFVYLIFGLHDRYFIQYLPNLEHESTVKSGRAFNNFLTESS